MSFASEVKDELALKESEYEKDELSALFKNAGYINISNGKMNLNFKSNNAKVAQKVFRKVKDVYGIKPETSIYKSMKLNKSTFYCLSIKQNVNAIIDELGLIEETNFKNIVRSEHRIKSYLAGCFMGCGSVNDPIKTNYHLELAVVDESYARDLVRFISKINLEAKIIKRRSQYVVYIKKAQEIADFLAAIGATNSYLKFEDYRMERDFYNVGNRLANMDIANSVKTNVAANKQLDDINIIQNSIGIAKLDQDLMLLANLRLENPEDSLKELAEKFNEKTERNISKSGINHLFIKIKTIADSYRKGSDENAK